MATAKDGSGHLNNKIDIPNFGAPVIESLGPIATMPRSTRTMPGSTAEERTYEDLRFARMKLNRIHEHVNRLDASSYMDQVGEEVLVVTR